jgi:hypothetical protein
MRRALLALALIATAGGVAHAQEVHAKPAISVERYTPPPGQPAYLGADDPDVLPDGKLAFDAASWYAARPITLRDLMTGAVVTVPVAWRAGLDLGIARGLGDRWQLGLAVPMALQGGDRLRGIGLSDIPLDRAVLGDIRLYAKARLVGAPGERGLAATVALTAVLPTGDDGDFAGEEGAVYEWRLAAGWRADRWAIAANAGARIRTDEVTLISPARPNGDELIGALAGEVAVPAVGRLLGGDDHFWATAEIDGVLGDSIGGSQRGPSPVEARAGARVRLCSVWSLTAGVGAGLTPHEIGAPAWRALVNLTWTQSPRGDFDGDGIPDALDQCPLDAEDKDGWQDADGCPDPDNDGDGIPDPDDKCPDEPEDKDGWEDTDGCPDHEERITPAAPAPAPGAP